MIEGLALLGGGLLRLLPEALNFFNKKTDNKHELEMLEKQFQLEQSRNAAQLEQVIQVQEGATDVALTNAYKEALRGQMQKVGIKWVDALNFAVRPIYAYTALALYYAFKLSLFVVAMQQSGGVWEKVLLCYTPEDFALLSGITSFYFVGRVIDKGNK
jgi:hypothetical protein